ncbi:MAG: hypothetical protein EOO88_41550 [Pedobacter sp.]|nr:MAG: hypothetical protein EOO88_41550 [Pedobacter sp.]
MKPSNPFKAAIEQHLKELAGKDPLFAETFKKANKSIAECCNYIMSEVKKSGRDMLTNDEVFGMAVHYYDEDDIKSTGKVQGRVVVSSTNTAPASKPSIPEKKKPIKKVVPDNQPALF